MKKIFLITDRKIENSEILEISRYFNPVYIDLKIHRRVDEIVSDFLILKINNNYFSRCKNIIFYARNKKILENYDIIFLRTKNWIKKKNLEKMEIDFLIEILPKKCRNKEDFLFNIKYNKMPHIRTLGNRICNFLF